MAPFDFYGKPVTHRTIAIGDVLVGRGSSPESADGKVIEVERDPAFNVDWTRVTLSTGERFVMVAGYHYPTVGELAVADWERRHGVASPA